MFSLNIGARSLRAGLGYVYYQGKTKDLYLATSRELRFGMETYQSYMDTTTEFHLGLVLLEFSRRLD
jgi:hypothetical protein